MFKVTSLPRILFVFIGLAFPALIVFSPLLFNGYVFADSDAILQTYPAGEFLRSALLAGDSFLWTPQVLTGFPLSASFLGGFYSPVYQWLFGTFDSYTTYHVLTTLNFILTAWFTYSLCRLLKLNLHASLFAGITLSMSTAYWLFAANLTVTSGYWSLPGLLLVTMLLHKVRHKLSYVGLVVTAGVALGLVFFNAHPQWPLQAILAAGALSLLLDMLRPVRKRLLFRGHTVIGLGLITIIALAFAWPQFNASLTQGTHSARAEGVAFEQAAEGALVPGDVASFIFPDLQVYSVTQKPGFLYIGAVGIILAFLSLWRRKNFFYKFFLGTFIVTFLISISHSPLFKLIHHLPGFETFREPSRFMYVGLFALVLLAAYGFEYVTRIHSIPHIRTAISRLWKLTVLGASVLLAWGVVVHYKGDALLSAALHYFDTNMFKQTTGLPLEHYHNVITQLFTQLVEGTTFAGTLFSIAFVSFVLVMLLLSVWTKNILTKRTLVTSLILITMVNMVGINVARSSFVPKTVATNVPKHITLMKEAHPTPFRVWSLFPGTGMFQKLDSVHGYNPTANVQLLTALVSPNSGMTVGVDSLDYYDNIMDRRHARILGHLGSDRSTYGESLIAEDISFEEKTQLFLERLPLLSIYNVAYITSLFPLDHESLTLFGEYSTTEFKIPVYVYENTAVQPRFFLTSNVTYAPELSEDESWDALRNHHSTEASTPLIECEICPELTPDSELAIAEVIPTFADLDNFEFSVETAKDQWLILGHHFHPHWNAQIDGSDAPIYRANFVNQALYIPSGKHVVLLKYTP